MQPSIAQKAKKIQLANDTTRNINSNLNPNVYDYGRSATTAYPMERETTSRFHTINVNRSGLGNQVAYRDVARNTLKETTVGLTSTSRNVVPFVLSGDSNTGMTNWDPKSNQKESLVNHKYQGQANKKDGMGYVVANYDAQTTIKETSLNTDYIGNASDTFRNDSMVYSTFQNPQKIRYAVHAENYNGPSVYFSGQPENRQKYDNADISINKEQTIIIEPEQIYRARNSSLGVLPVGENLVGEIKSNDNLLFKERPNYINGYIGNINNNVSSLAQFGDNTTIGFYHQNSQKDVFSNVNPMTEHNRFISDIIDNQLSTNPWYNIKRT